MIVCQAVVTVGNADHCDYTAATGANMWSNKTVVGVSANFVRLALYVASRTWVATVVSDDIIQFQSAVPIETPTNQPLAATFGTVTMIGNWNIAMEWIDKWGQIAPIKGVHMTRDPESCHWKTKDVVQDVISRSFMFMDNMRRTKSGNYYWIEVPRS
jgi:hypothetical protein